MMTVKAFMRQMPVSARIAAENIAARQGVSVETVVASYLGATKNFQANAKTLFLGSWCYNANGKR